MNRLSSGLTQEYLSSDLSAMKDQDVHDLMNRAIINLQKGRNMFARPPSAIFHFIGFILSYLPTPIYISIRTMIRKMLNRPDLSPVANIPDDFQILIQILTETPFPVHS
jgi:hypothetical protein